MVLLVDHDVEGVVTRAAKVHVNNLPVTTEASALLHALGMDSISMKMSTPSGLLQPPSSPSVDSKMKSTVQPIVSIDTVTKASARHRGSSNRNSEWSKVIFRNILRECVTVLVVPITLVCAVQTLFTCRT